MIRCAVPGSEVVTRLPMSRCAVCAAQDPSSFFFVWATGHVTETLPDLPTTTNPYNVNRPTNPRRVRSSAVAGLCRLSGSGSGSAPAKGLLHHHAA